MKNILQLNLPALFTLLVWLSGCSSIHQPNSYQLQAPQSFSQELSATTQLEKDWWKNFNSPYLIELIEAALTHNPDINIATENIIQAELNLRKAGASRYPDLNLSASTAKNYNKPDGSSSSTLDNTNLGINASYEIDIWNKNAAAIRAKEALMDASEFDFQAAKLSLTASVAQTYFDLISLQERVILAQKNIQIALRLLEITQTKYDNGVATQLDLSRQKTSLLNQEAALIPLENNLILTQAALAVLTGKPPQEFATGLSKITNLTLTTPTPGIPLEVLQRRPDIAASEAQLIAQDSNIHQAKANRWPALKLTANGGLASSDLLSLTTPTRTLGLSLGITQSLFDGGKNTADVKLAESKYRVAEKQHYKLILQALLEVEEALNNSSSFRKQEAAQQKTLSESQKSLELAEYRYKEGADSLNTVLDTQRNLFQAQEQLVKIMQQRLNANVDLYKVLGGGF